MALTAHQQTRLPFQEPPRRGAGQVLLGVAALLGTLVIVVGVPLALLSIFGPPWPSETPSLDWLTQPTTSETVMAVLAVIVWLAWLHFVVCLVVEAVVAVRRRGIAPSVPGGGLGTQALARNIVLSVMVLVGVSATAVGPAGAADMAPSSTGTSHPTHSVAGAHAGTTISPTARHGQLPKVGETETATRADERAGLTTYYQVKPPEGRHYDTLWDIAERYLGSGLRYKEIVELNRGLHQPDGSELTNPDLIYPGWVLRMPADASGPGLRVVEHAGTLPQTAPSLDEHRAGGGGQQAGDQAAADQSVRAADDGGGLHIDAAWSPLFGVAGGLVMGGAFLALRRRRAARPLGELWGPRGGAASAGPGPDGPDGPGPGGPGSSAAVRLRDEADPGLTGWLDRALRGSGIGAGVPAPSQVSVGPGGLAMLFAGATTVDPPQGWTRINDRVWAVGTDVAFPVGGAAPCPGLVTIGRRPDGSLLLIDPEAVPGLISLEGPEDIARGVAMSMAVDTATHPWADRRTVTMVGFAGDLTGIDDAVHRADDVGRVLESLENLARYHRGACRQVGARTAREARVTSPGVADWTYHLVLCSGLPSLTELSRLHALASDPQVPVGVVVIGSLASADMRLAAQPDGRLTSPMHAIDVEAQQLTADAADALADLYAAPPASGVTLEEWAAAIADQPTYDAAPDAQVRIGVLGPIEIDAPGEVEPDRVEFLSELACYLALHPQGVHVNRLTAALWPRGVEPETRDGALRQLERWLGADAAPVLVETGGVWSLRPGSVRVDWDEFRSLVNAAGQRPADREQVLRRALDLVRGRPFASAPGGRYSWLEASDVESDILLAIGLVTLAVAETATARGDAATARSVLDRGLEAMPANEDLWRARLRLEARYGDADALRAVADALYRTLSEEGSYGASGETDALVAELLPGYRSAVA